MPRTLWVDQANATCSDALAREQVTRRAPWCTLSAAAAAARAGDTVQTLPGRYRGPVRPRSSGTAFAPIRFVAPTGGVVIDGEGQATALVVAGVSWLAFRGFTVTGAAGQGVYVVAGTHIELTRMTVSGNRGPGIQVRATDVTVSASSISGNGSTGISELLGSNGNLYLSNTISGNGKDGKPYNGDGIQLNGTGATIRGNTITGNGDRGIYEHGVYAGASSSGYVVESNTLADNAASDVKAAGSDGIVRYNRLGDSRLGLVFSDNVRPVSAYYNLIAGRFEHAVFFTTRARARLWQNTILQSSPSTSLGDRSAVYVGPADSAEVRNDLICNASAGGGGLALSLGATTRRTALRSDANWFCGTDPQGRDLVVDGRRTTLADWRRTTGQDTRSLSTRLAGFTSDLHVSSSNYGSGRGQPLALTRDYGGTAVPRGHPDIGAYQSTSEPMWAGQPAPH